MPRRRAAIIHVSSGRMLALEPGFRIASDAADARRAVFGRGRRASKASCPSISPAAAVDAAALTTGQFQPYRRRPRFPVLAPDELRIVDARAAPDLTTWRDQAGELLCRRTPDPGSIDRGARHGIKSEAVTRTIRGAVRSLIWRSAASWALRAAQRGLPAFRFCLGPWLAAPMHGTMKV